MNVFYQRRRVLIPGGPAKPLTHNYIYIYDSYIPMIYKTGLVSTLLQRSFRICTSWIQVDTEIKKIKSILTMNAYPSMMLDRKISNFLNNVCKPSVTHSVEPQTLQIILPFLGSFTKLV